MLLRPIASTNGVYRPSRLEGPFFTFNTVIHKPLVKKALIWVTGGGESLILVYFQEVTKEVFWEYI